MSSSQSTRRKTEVVIVGGCSGATLAYSLLHATRPLKLDPTLHNVTLISQLPYNVWLLSAGRMTVTTEENIDNTERGLLPLDRLFADDAPGSFRQGKVVRVREDCVELEDGATVRFDFLALATGCKWPGPLNFDWTKDKEVRSHTDLWRNRMARSKRIVIVGGGPAGVEMAGEIAQFHPGADITLVHSRDELLTEVYPDRFRAALKTKLESHGVHLVLGERVVNLAEFDDGFSTSFENGSGAVHEVRTKSGRVVECDLVIPTLGTRPNTSMLADLRGGSCLTSSGEVRISPHLNIVFSGGDDEFVARNMFAIGDIIDFPERHLVYSAAQHARIVSRSILACLDYIGRQQRDGRKVDLEEVAMAEYRGMAMTDLWAVICGSNEGTVWLPFFGGVMFGDWFARLAKARDLLITKMRRELGL